MTGYHEARLQAALTASGKLRRVERRIRAMAHRREPLGADAVTWVAARDELVSRGCHIPSINTPPTEPWWRRTLGRITR